MNPQKPQQEMTSRWLALPDDALARGALGVVDRLRAAGHAAFVVGGCVRDLVAGLAPKDWDVATSALPAEVSALFGRVIEVGVAFGVLRVPVRSSGQRFEIEVATFRADGPYSDGRHPDRVRFTSAREDVLRRDFTLNGLLLDPEPADATGRRRGQVVDWVGGLRDLDQGLLRAIGRPEDRFSEDSLRILRAVRFAARFDLKLEPDTRRAIMAHAAGLGAVSRERIRGELAGALQLHWAARAVKLLGELGLHVAIWPPLEAVDPGLKRAARRMKDLCDGMVTWQPDLQVRSDGLPLQLDLELPLALAILLFDIRPSDRAGVSELARDLRLSGAHARRLARTWELAVKCRDLHGRLAAAGWQVGAGVATDPLWIRLLREPEADAALLLLACVASAGQSPRRDDLLRLRWIRASASASAWSPRPWIHGQTLQALGHGPSPRFKVALDAAEDVQLSGGDREQALAAALACLA